MRRRTTPASRERIGTQLRDLREKSGLTQADAAREAGIDPSFVSLIESGRRDVSLGTLGALANAYNAVAVVGFRRRA
jgi:UDP-N-acetylglucosamine 1-carboxyvinyltransferase